MQFEFDLDKSKANKIKHGIHFEAAQKLWDAEKFVEADANSPVSEKRSFRIAAINDRLWFCVYTMRGENIRLISVRHVRANEQEFYEQS